MEELEKLIKSKPFVEIDRNTNEVLSVEKQEGIVFSSDCRPATEEEIRICYEDFKATGKCTKFHVFHDEQSYLADIRICDVCGKTIALI